MSWSKGSKLGGLERTGSKLERAGRLERAWSKLGVSWSKLGDWRELGAS